VAALSPDPASVRAALGLATPGRWEVYGADDRAVWGMCGGSGKQPYRITVDLDGPAYSCSCPSRKFPCKHALALLLLWASNLVPEEPAEPVFAADWLRSRDSRDSTPVEPRERDEEAAARRAAERHRRVGDGLAELDRWLRDRVRTGLAHAAAEGYAPVEQVAARMVDAQAPGVAGMVRRSAATPASGAGWPARLLSEYARMRLLVRAYEQVETLPPELAATVRSRVGFTVARDDVLAGRGVRDRWQVQAVRDAFEGKVDTRRVWLRGAESGRWALVLLFAAGGAELGSHPDAVLLPGTVLDAELHFYPGRPPLRALIGGRHGELATAPAAAAGSVADLLDEYATALADDPWLSELPAVLAGVPVEHDAGWRLRCADATVPLDVGEAAVWLLVATSGGAPVPVAGEWTGTALRPLTCWHGDQAVRL
jgi:hypothetical protein